MPSGLVNRSRTRKYILESVVARRPGWTCTRVAGEVLEDLEAYVSSLIRKIGRDGLESLDSQPQSDLLVKAVVKRRLRELLDSGGQWFGQTETTTEALRFVQHRLETRILAMVDRHPSGCGATFKTT
jgi:hypothetical protein